MLSLVVIVFALVQNLGKATVPLDLQGPHETSGTIKSSASMLDHAEAQVRKEGITNMLESEQGHGEEEDDERTQMFTALKKHVHTDETRSDNLPGLTESMGWPDDESLAGTKPSRKARHIALFAVAGSSMVTVMFALMFRESLKRRHKVGEPLLRNICT